MAQQLLKTKFHLPVAKADVVRRSRLTRMIERGVAGPLTLIAAPAGAGKSTLVSEWRQSNEGGIREFAWLSLVNDDDELIRFFTYLAAALDQIRPGIGGAVAFLFRAPGSGEESDKILTALINEIA